MEGGGGVSTLKRLLSDLLDTLQVHDSWRNSGRRPHRNTCQPTTDVTVSSPASDKTTSTSQ